MSEPRARCVVIAAAYRNVPQDAATHRIRCERALMLLRCVF